MNGYYYEPDEVLDDTFENEDEEDDEFEEVATQTFRNVRCVDYFNEKVSYLFPYVVLTKRDVFPFIEIKATDVLSEPSELFASVDYRIGMFLNQFRILRRPEYIFLLASNTGRSSRVSGGESEQTIFMYRTSLDGSDALQEVRRDDVISIVDMSIADATDDESNEIDFDELSLKLSQASSEPSESAATHFIQEPEKAFYLALFGGFLGAHRFYLRMYGSGLLYALTFGLLGVGWFFDCLEIVLGVWKKKGKKLKRLPNAKKHFIELVVTLAVVVAALLFLPFF